ncbi:ATP-dependent dethiobiotin synthetase BioD [Corynebacterium sp. zg912]|uniref:ATP-dependent dethiobiotin synthetase BioD n=1 Tax=Corynebacterium wankanglinii TaxID=2735136 RepID=A0A7H0KBP7_9CORY|nr:MULTISPECIES: dethiobiotin synthase [Corynebacterium]MBA1837463.1 ATP-dependent dethiobiotin synthetase BioD [Corynebacterium wankanglinii]MCR5928701.1 ATP-dependent dethiobiotin synthetase BioD [Corynebacterium sp. zg912]QNP94713.1 ATP-dependent dethiobiotin synthetase BioD [Corynebacterium wankanglinii]
MIVAVTGTNTDVGKTVATAAIASVLRRRGIDVVAAKPIQTGEAPGQGDASAVAKLAGIATFERWRYPEPLAPNLAARRAGIQTPSLNEVTGWIRSLNAPDRVVLVEGAGGLLVRLADDYTLADIASALGAPLVVVTSLGLGSLNLAELTCEQARARGLDVLGIIGGAMPEVPDLPTRLNVEELPEVTGAEYWGHMPEGCGSLDAAEFAEVAWNAIGETVRVGSHA